MSFDDSYRGIFMVYRVFGLVPFEFHFQSITSESTSNKMRKNCFPFMENLWFICLLLYELYILVHSSYLWYDSYASDGKINTFNGFRTAMAFIFRLCIVIITIESHCNRNVQVKILHNLCKIDRIFDQKLELKIDYRRLKRMGFVAFLKWFPIHALATSIFIVNSSTKNKITIQDIAPVMRSYYPLIKLALFSAAYITFGILIRHRIQVINEALKIELLFAHHESPFDLRIDGERCNQHEAREFQRFIWLWRLSTCAHETIQLMSNTFKWSISMSFFANIFNLCAILFNFFHETLESISQNGIGSLYIPISYMLYSVFCFGATVQLANSVAVESEKTARKLHQISLSGAAISDKFSKFVSNF